MNESQMILVDVEKISQGMQQVFCGCASIFEALGKPADCKIHDLSDQAIKEVKKEVVSAKSSENDFSESPTGESSKADNMAAANKEEQHRENPSSGSISVDDIIKIAAAKISANRQNSEKINQLLKRYYVNRMSELPLEKYEAFLTDLSQL